MKLYITGPVASGKSTLARRIAAATGVPCYHLDDVRYEPLPGAASGNRNARRKSARRFLMRYAAFARGLWKMPDACVFPRGCGRPTSWFCSNLRCFCAGSGSCGAGFAKDAD